MQRLANSLISAEIRCEMSASEPTRSFARAAAKAAQVLICANLGENPGFRKGRRRGALWASAPGRGAWIWIA
jgi:hypothetical protein